MATSFDTVYDLFFKRLKENPDFFRYTNVPEEEVLQLMKTSAFDSMIEAISIIYTFSTPDINFNDYDETNEQFNVDLTRGEIQMLVNNMFYSFVSRDLAKLQIYGKFFTTNEINTFSNAQERKTFVDMLNNMNEKNVREIKSYNSRDRLTNALKTYSEVSL